MVLREKAYRIIKERIIKGEYRPGQPLNEKAIIDELNISRTPFREAIHALNEENLVQVYPNRGIFVRELTLQDIMDGFDVRYLLEPYVLELAAVRMPGSLVEELIRRIDELDQTNYHALLNEDDYFHATLIEYTDNKQLSRIMKNLYEYNRFQVILLDDPKSEYISSERLANAVESLMEHRAVLCCIQEGNIPEAVEKMRFHLTQARKRTLQ